MDIKVMFLDSDYILSEDELGVRSRELNRHVRQTVSYLHDQTC